MNTDDIIALVGEPILVYVTIEIKQVLAVLFERILNIEIRLDDI